MNYKLFYLFIILAVSACSYEQEAVSELDIKLENYIKRAAEDGTLEYFVLPNETDYNSIPQEPRNPLNSAKVELGKLLFFETGLALDAVKLSGMETYSCATCHIPEAGFKPGKMQGLADGGVGIGVSGEGRFRNLEYQEDELDVQGIRPLPVINVAYFPNTQWSGRFGATHANKDLEHLFGVISEETEINKTGLQGLEAQNIEGIKLHRMIIDEAVISKLGYTELFDKAFPDFDMSERYSDITGSFALSAYLRALLTNKAPFQKWLKGDKLAMTDKEKRGAKLFFDKANCYACHSGKNLGSNRYFAVGVNDMDMIPSYNRNENDDSNLGRGRFTGDVKDYYKFRVPQLYNLKGTAFYFHGSSKRNLDEVIDYFNDAIPENDRVPASQIAIQFRGLGLTEIEQDDLKAFLEDGLFDAELTRYAPDAVLSGNCFPNNDPKSRREMGCD